MNQAKQTAPSETLLYPGISTLTERFINDKTKANTNFNNSIRIIKDIQNYRKTETNKYSKKFSKYRSDINIGETTKHTKHIINYHPLQLFSVLEKEYHEHIEAIVNRKTLDYLQSTERYIRRQRLS